MSPLPRERVTVPVEDDSYSLGRQLQPEPSMLRLIVVHFEGEEDIDGADNIVALLEHRARAVERGVGCAALAPQGAEIQRKTPGAGAHCVKSTPHDCARESFKRTLMAKRTLTVPMTLLCCVNTARERSIME